MNTTECITVAIIIALGLFPYENNAGLPIECTKSDEEIQYTTKQDVNVKQWYLLKYPNGKVVSPLHDIPLCTTRDGVFRAVIVMPKGSHKGKTISMDAVMNPIVYIQNRTGLPPKIWWNYGALTQTWENGSVVDPRTNKLGDNGQLDVIVLGKRTYDCGAVVNVKILGALPMIITESDRTNWQMIAFDANDPSAATVNNIQDFTREYPDFLVKIEEWLAPFNTRLGDRINQFLEVVDAPTAVQVVFEKHGLWKALQENPKKTAMPGISLNNTTLGNQWTMEVEVL